MNRLTLPLCILALCCALSGCVRRAPAITDDDAPEVIAPDETTTVTTTAPPTTTAATTAAVQEKTGLLSAFLKSAPPADSLTAKMLFPQLRSQQCELAMTVQNDAGNYDAVVTMQGADYAMKADLNGVTVRLLCIDGKRYLCIPKDAFVASLESQDNTDGVVALMDVLGVSDAAGMIVEITEHPTAVASFSRLFLNLLAGLDETVTFVKKENQTVGEIGYLCETFQGKRGTTQFYYEDGALKFIETQRGEAQTHSAVREITQLATQAMTLPENYADITEVYNLYMQQDAS